MKVDFRRNKKRWIVDIIFSKMAEEHFIENNSYLEYHIFKNCFEITQLSFSSKQADLKANGLTDWKGWAS